LLFTLKDVNDTLPPIVGWCQEREKIDWLEARKFDCRLVHARPINAL